MSTLEIEEAKDILMRKAEAHERENLKTVDEKLALVKKNMKALAEHKQRNTTSQEEEIKFAKEVLEFWNVVKEPGAHGDEGEWKRFAPGHEDNEDGLDAMLDEVKGVDYKRIEGHFDKELKKIQRDFSREFTARVSHVKNKSKVVIEDSAEVIKEKTGHQCDILEDWLEDMTTCGLFQLTMRV